MKHKQYFVWFSIDVVTIEKTGENFRLLYDGKGRFTTHRITAEEAKVRISTSSLLRNSYHTAISNKIQPTAGNPADINVDGGCVLNLVYTNLCMSDLVINIL